MSRCDAIAAPKHAAVPASMAEFHGELLRRVVGEAGEHEATTKWRIEQRWLSMTPKQRQTWQHELCQGGLSAAKRVELGELATVLDSIAILVREHRLCGDAGDAGDVGDASEVGVDDAGGESGETKYGETILSGETKYGETTPHSPASSLWWFTPRMLRYLQAIVPTVVRSKETGMEQALLAGLARSFLDGNLDEGNLGGDGSNARAVGHLLRMTVSSSPVVRASKLGKLLVNPLIHTSPLIRHLLGKARRVRFGQLLRKYGPVLRRLRDLDLVAPADIDALWQTCSTTNSDDDGDDDAKSATLLETEFAAKLRDHAPQRQKNLTASLDASRAARVVEFQDASAVRAEFAALRAPPAFSKLFAALRADLADTIGFQSLKDHVDGVVNDLAASRQLGEKTSALRHAFLEGNAGTGKRSAADFLAKLHALRMSTTPPPRRRTWRSGARVCQRGQRRT